MNTEKLYQLQAKLSAYRHALGLLYYDGVTTAPKGTAANRAQTTGVLSEEFYKLATSQETFQLLEAYDDAKASLTEKEQRMVYLLLKDMRRMEKIPADEYVAYQKLVVEAEDVWHKAKETSDWPLFQPYLEKLFDTTRRFEGYVHPQMDPYDSALDQYEEGLTKEACEAFFGTLRKEIVPLIEAIGKAPQLDNRCIHGTFSDGGQEALAIEAMKLMGLDLDHCGLGVTEHPFTTSLGSHEDVRITTHYQPEDVASSLYSVIHEGGHALYDLGSSSDMKYTVLDGGVSMGIHESQSRFYENLLGRSQAYIHALFPHLTRIFPDQMQGVTEEAFYKAVNLVTPSLIRTEADEVTYCLHVMIRYELEKAVLGGDLAVKDLPGEWNKLYKEYLGVDVPDHRSGVLQDSHWSGGLFGYFPSYALGSAYGAHLLDKMRETVDVDGCLSKGDFGPINAWNREKIWQHGCLYSPAQLLETALGEPFDPSHYTNYLKKKYSQLYGL